MPISTYSMAPNARTQVAFIARAQTHLFVNVRAYLAASVPTGKMMRKAIEQRSPWFLALTSYGNNGKSVEDMCLGLFKDSEGMGKRQSCRERTRHDF
jgi:hypothetical protein